MIVHLPDATVIRYGDDRWKAERVRAFGLGYEGFWNRQERIADRAWSFAAGAPTLPVDVAGVAHLLSIVRPQHVPLLFAQGRTVDSIFPRRISERLRAFIDAQLWITAQTDARHADLSYGSTALDIAREGTYHLPGGISAIAIWLSRAARLYGATIQYNATVTSIERCGGRATGVELADGSRHVADAVVAAVPIEDVERMLGGRTEELFKSERRWSAVTAYAGVPSGIIPNDITLHHQLLLKYDQAWGEGNSQFISISASDDRTRARSGGRAVTFSTHIDAALWEQAAGAGTERQLRARYAEQFRRGLEIVLQRADIAFDVFEVGTPATFAKYTNRHRGWVGGRAQTPRSANLRALSHRSRLPNVMLCGDSVFPGQSTVGATLSGLNAARALGAPLSRSRST